jgi:hypothetical protein
VGVLAKIHVQNYGRIRDAEIELRPFTVFIGPNNTNKTWVAYAINGLVQSLSAARFFFRTNSAMEPVPGFHPPVGIIESCDAAAKRISLGLIADATVSTSSMNVYRAELLEELHLDEWVDFSLDAGGLANLLALEESPLKDACVTLKMKRRDVLDGGLINHLEISLERPSSNLRVVPRDNAGNSRYETNIGLRSLKGPPNASDVQKWISDFTRWLALGVFQGSVAFPAERNGLLSTYKFLTGPTTQIALNHASQDFVNLVRYADNTRRSSGGPCRHVNQILERMVLGGTLSFGPDAESSGMAYTLEGGPRVDVEAAASLVRSLAGFYCYFQHHALDHDLIIVDEPEMNAHPEAQLRLTEFFSALVHQEFRVLITTHSPYMVDHLNNLVAAWDVPGEKRGSVPASAYAINPDDVAVYLFDNGEVKDIFNRDEAVIDLETFGKSSDYVNNLYSQILRLQAAR